MSKTMSTICKLEFLEMDKTKAAESLPPTEASNPSVIKLLLVVDQQKPGLANKTNQKSPP